MCSFVVFAPGGCPCSLVSRRSASKQLPCFPSYPPGYSYKLLQEVAKMGNRTCAKNRNRTHIYIYIYIYIYIWSIGLIYLILVWNNFVLKLPTKCYAFIDRTIQVSARTAEINQSSITLVIALTLHRCVPFRRKLYFIYLMWLRMITVLPALLPQYFHSPMPRCGT